MTKIIRTPTRAEGGITPDEKAAMGEISKKWTAIAFRTDPIDVAKITTSIESLYEVAGLKKPRVVVVSSPMVMAFAYGASAAIWHNRKEGNGEYESPLAPTANDAGANIASATASATGSDILFGLHQGNSPERPLAEDARKACFDIAGQLGLDCAKNWKSAYQGGNMWAYSASYFDAMKNVIGLDLPEFGPYQSWEDCAIHGGFRVMHEEFCIVSDFPETLKVDEENRPHCEDGPSHKWRDGWSLYHWHGTKVPEAWIMSPESITPKEVIGTADLELRAAGMQIIGWANLLDALGAELIDEDIDPVIGALYSVELEGLEGRHLIVKYTCPRNGVMGQPVPKINPNDDKEITTVLGAKAFLAGTTLADYLPPEIRT
jgi:hypothetical protein